MQSRSGAGVREGAGKKSGLLTYESAQKTKIHVLFFIKTVLNIYFKNTRLSGAG